MLGLRFGLPLTLEPVAKLMLSARFSRAMLVLLLMLMLLLMLNFRLKLVFMLTP